ncbi:L-aspartate oxidase [Ktedonosporobacter rubrisoli]|uniref:L-aspartate oxidase n=1 Tax=Ktedonosporobacter rubrisoli TaxID=2509675 RepID=A0A4P6K4B8_KTERU|nr:L-aspartate oxidase [Ktedonosporobacter rubrisoli]QBD82670.1 L-aspartate oxidase [Ktedonosporobacter rubrisoli]
MAYSQPFDVAIIGGGIAGLTVALRLPERMRIALFTKGQVGESNTRYAQGGLAVALGTDDSPELHFRDTMAAGAGLCDAEAVRILVEQAPAAVRWLIEMGVHFDRAAPGSEAHSTADGLLLGREGAHSRWRVLHAGGDATGAEIERALIAALQKRSSVTVYEETFVSDLLLREDICSGVEAIDKEGNSFEVAAQAIVLASGGAGGLWLHTSNPAGATADGLALAWRAGAALADLEFMQFHPTVLVANGTSHLISEAVRGEGAYLRNHANERFMPRYSEQAELAPRDVVARAILSEMLSERAKYQYLDLRHLPRQSVYERFPTISAICREHGLDMASDLLPIEPAAHYCMGGVLVDSYGRTSVPGLYAVGEVSCTGVHGANRLASNSLLEGLVYGIRLAGYLDDSSASPGQQILPAGVSLIPYESTLQEDILSSGNEDELSTLHTCERLRQIMWEYVSLRRDQHGLLEAQREIRRMRSEFQAGNKLKELAPIERMHYLEVRNMLQIAEIVIMAALQRQESRGSHWRADYQSLDTSLEGCRTAFRPSSADPNGPMQPRKEIAIRA